MKLADLADSEKTTKAVDEKAPVSRSPWRNGTSSWPYPELDLLSLELSGFPRFPFRPRRNH
jgi:hypothetical protein